MPFDNPTERVELPAEYAMEIALLDQIALVIPTKRQWCKGKEVDNAGRHCIIGAVNVVFDDLTLTTENYRACRRVELRLNALCGGNIPRFNDHLFTRHRHVMKLIRAARASFE